MSAKNLSEDQSWTMRRLTAVTAVFLGVALVVIDSTIVNLALPVLAQSLSVSDATSTWLVIAYQMVLVTLLFPSIVLASVLGRRQLFLLGIALFTLASLGCCLAGSFGVLVCFRILQAAGGSAILSVNISLVEQLFKWFRIPYNPAVKQHFVPEARIEKVQNRMFSSPYVEVRILPVFFRLF